MAAGDTPGPSGTAEDGTLKTSPQTSCLLKHPRMRPTPTGTLEVSVTDSRTNGAGVSETTSEDHVWFEDWWMVASLCDE
jgi:hypothetical protein